MGRGELFRFMSASASGSGRCIGAGRSEVPAHAVPAAAVDFGAHPTPVRLRHPLPR
jgi:hypothetical protein